MKMTKRIKNRLKNIINEVLDQPKNVKEVMLRSAFIRTVSSKIKGEYFEFGVYRGRSFTAAYKLGQKHGLHDMKYYAFDSFEGLPEPTEIEGNEKFRKAQYACSEEDFKNILKKSKINMHQVQCIKGFYDKSLTKELQFSLLPKKASIVWIDCDLYESTVPVLDFIIPFLQNGTVLCFDDWFSYAGHQQKGEIRATNEWLQDNPNIKLIDYKTFGNTGKSFLVYLEEENKSI